MPGPLSHIFFYSWGFVSTEFSFKLLYYNQRKFLVPLRLGSRFLQVLLIFFELKLATVARLSAASSCRSVPCTAATSSLEHHLLVLDSKIQQQCIFQVYIVSLSRYWAPQKIRKFHPVIILLVPSFTHQPCVMSQRAPRLTTDSLTLPHSNLVFIPLWTICFC